METKDTNDKSLAFVVDLTLPSTPSLSTTSQNDDNNNDENRNEDNYDAIVPPMKKKIKVNDPSDGGPLIIDLTDAAATSNECIKKNENEVVAIPPPTCILFDEDDGGVITHDVLPLLEFLRLPNKNRTTSSSNKNNIHTNIKRNIVTCGFKSEIVHIRQRDKWSCGYRNLQMVLSFLLPRNNNDAGSDDCADINTSNDDSNGIISLVNEDECDDDDNEEQREMSEKNDVSPLFNRELYHHFSNVSYNNNNRGSENTTTTTTRITIPPISLLQYHLEQSWTAGFDPKGSAYYHGKIIGKKVYIGAAEVTSLLRYYGVDATVVQFLHSKQLRAVIGPFCWWYFNNGLRHDNDDDANNRLVTAEELLGMAQSKPLNLDDAGACLKEGTEHTIMRNDDNLCPLYLQWEGHSVTIVGVEKCVSPVIMNDTASSAASSCGKRKRLYSHAAASQETKTHTRENNGYRVGKDDIDENCSDVTTNGKGGYTCTFNLLLFDPLKNGTILKSSLLTTKHQTHHATNRQQQHPENYNDDDDGELLNKMRLPVQKLLSKDLQIIHCGTLPLTNQDRMDGRTIVKAVTTTKCCV